jgi:outer membrane PBP1 activator LpoA protein
MSLIASTTLGSSADAITFGSIPLDGTDLVAICSLRERDTNNFTLVIKLNGSLANFSARILQGSGSSVVSAATSSPTNLTILANPSNSTSNTFGNGQIYIANYTGSTNKSISIDSVQEYNQTEAYQRITAALLSDTAAITSFEKERGSWMPKTIPART